MNRTCADLAKKCGVSTATVSRVLNNSRLVRRETRDWVLQVETGFPIDRKRTPFTVAVICSIQRGAFGGYFSLIHSAVVQALSKANVHVELVSDEELHLLDEYAIWGAINLSPLPIADFWSENFNLPLVNVNSPAQQLHRIGAVLMRDKEAIEEAYDLLWNLGHRKIAYYASHSKRNSRNVPVAGAHLPNRRLLMVYSSRKSPFLKEPVTPIRLNFQKFWNRDTLRFFAPMRFQHCIWSHTYALPVSESRTIFLLCSGSYRLYRNICLLRVVRLCKITK